MLLLFAFYHYFLLYISVLKSCPVLLSILSKIEREGKNGGLKKDNFMVCAAMVKVVVMVIRKEEKREERDGSKSNMRLYINVYMSVYVCMLSILCIVQHTISSNRLAQENNHQTGSTLRSTDTCSAEVPRNKL